MIATSSTSLRVENVSQRFGSLFALSSVTLDVRGGELLSIIGPSGCGKSTLLKIICGAISPTTGHVRISGKPLAGMTSMAHRVVMIWQTLALFPHLDVAGNVEFGLAVRGIAAKERQNRVAEALELVDLNGFAHRHIETLSGGEQQRVGLARALVVKPSVLLLDEPMRGLDRQLRIRLMSKIRELHQQLGMTMVMVTHDQGEALGLSTRIAVMSNGRIEQIAPPSQVVSEPANAFVAQTVGDRCILRGCVSERNANRVCVETSGGRFKAVMPHWIEWKMESSQEVIYVIDSHNLALGCDGDEKISGSVTALIEGGVAQLIEIDGGAFGPMRCKYSPKDKGTSARIGEKVTISWSSADAFVLPV